MKHEHIEEKLAAYLFHELEPADHEMVEKHLETCELCRAELTQLESTVGMIRDGFPALESTDEEVDRIVAEATKADVRTFRTPIRYWLPVAAALVVGVIAISILRVGNRQGLVDLTAPQAKAVAESQSTPLAQKEMSIKADTGDLSSAIPYDRDGQESRATIGKAGLDEYAPAMKEVQKAGEKNEVQDREMGEALRTTGVRSEESAPELRTAPSSAAEPREMDALYSDRKGQDYDQTVERSKDKRAAGEIRQDAPTEVAGTGSTSASGLEKSRRAEEKKAQTPPPAPITYGEFEEKVTVSNDRLRGGSATHDPSNVGGSVPPNGEPYPSMFFEHAGVNPFIVTEEDPLSTFAVDVDTASYTVARNYLMRGQLPPQDAVRVEEFVNAFPQGYPEERNEDWAIHVDGVPSPFGDGYHLVRVGLAARSIPEESRKPVVLTFVIDVSGSMNRENRLELVKRSLRLLVDRLDSRDSIGIAVYGSRGESFMSHERVTPENREEILQSIRQLRPGGSTNAEEGLRIGYRMAFNAFDPRAVNRVILCSDGVANVGRTGAEDILEQLSVFAQRGVFLTAIGFGMGNYNDVLMERLADRGNGMYAYIDTYEEAERFFLQKLTGLLQTVAKDVKIQVEFNPDTVLRYRLLGYENRDVRDVDFRNDRVDAGEVNAGHTVIALYEVKLAKRGNDLGVVRIRYKQPDSDTAREIARSIHRKKLARKLSAASPYLVVDALVAQFAEILRGSYWAKEDGGFTAILKVAGSIPKTAHLNAQTDEFFDLVSRAETILNGHGSPGITTN